MDYRQRVRQEAQAVGLDPNIAEAVLLRESAGNPNAVSSAGAQGLMQLMPATAKEMGVDPRDPVQNLQGGVRYLKQQIDQFGPAGGIAAYNAGPGRFIKTGGDFNALPAETRAYVPNVMNKAAQLAQGGGQVSNQPTSPSMDQVINALGKARAAGDQAAVEEISGMLKQKFDGARKKALDAGDAAAIQEIDAKFNELTGAPVAAGVQSDIQKPAPTKLPDIEIPAKQQQQQAPQDPLWKRGLRAADDFVRGAADTLTFGYADEIAAKMDQLTGGGQSGKKTYDEALAAQRQRDKEGGGSRIAGQVAGALLPGAGVVGAIRAPANATRLGRAAAGAGTGAVQGALYGSGSAEGDINDRIDQALVGGASGAALGGVLGAAMPATVSQVATKFEKKAGDPASAAIDAEIIRDLNKVAKNEANRGNPVQAIQANALEQKYVTDASRAIKQLGKDGIQKLGVSADDVQAAVQNRRILTAEELDALRGNTAGNALADAIEKAQRTRSLTAPKIAADNIVARTGRALLDLAPIPQPLRFVGQRVLGARQTREDTIQKLIGDKNAAAAEDILSRVGPSAATRSLEELQGAVQQAQIAAQAKIDATKAARELAKTAAKKAEANPNAAISELQGKDPTYLLGLSNPNGVPRNEAQMAEFSKVIRDQMLARQAKQEAAKLAQKGGEQVLDTRAGVLKATRTPLGGPFQELLQGGKSGLNLTTDEAVKGLRILEKKTNDPVLRDAIQRMRSSSGEVPGAIPDPNAFYGVQNAMRRLQEQGILSGGQPAGALSAVSPVRNPISYAANVRNAEQAVALAESSAPSKALALFARKVAGTKSIADKQKLIADRLKNASPDEAAFLDQFVSPLTNFGKK